MQEAWSAWKGEKSWAALPGELKKMKMVRHFSVPLHIVCFETEFSARVQAVFARCWLWVGGVRSGFALLGFDAEPDVNNKQDWRFR